jgi:outer membrane immunogenic protein
VKKLVLALSSVAAFSGTALAADMAVKAPFYKAAPPVTVYNWTGFYVGGNIGYSWNTSNVNTNVIESPTYLGLCSLNGGSACGVAVGNAASPGLRPNAFVGGAQAGYNYQVNKLVVGIEADINSFRNRASSTVSQAYPGFPGIQYTTTTNVSTDWLFTLRPRIGVAAAPGVLLYATAGLAVTNLRYAEAFSDNQVGALATQAAAVSQTRAGWTAGAGLEAKLAANWTGKIEYFYADLGSVSTTSRLVTINPANGGDTFNQSANLRSNIVRVGVNYHFGGPVVAKY